MSPELREYNTLRYAQKRGVVRTYLNQGIEMIKIFQNVIPNTINNPSRSDLISWFSIIDDETANFGQVLGSNIRDSELAIIELGGLQTQDIAGRKGLQFRLSGDFGIRTQKSIENVGSFDLSTNVWGTKSKTKLYQNVQQVINLGATKSEVTSYLENYLLNSPSRGQFYNVTRVVDTEFQRAYFQGSIKGSREFNQTFEQVGSKIAYIRSLSPSHKIADICDSLVGVYDTTKDVPEIPSHPNCKCLLNRRVVDTNYTKFKALPTSQENLFVDKKYNQVNIMI